MSSLGLVEMTRKRIRPSLIKILCEPCSYCDGKGYIKRKSTVANEIFRELEREVGMVENQKNNFVVHCRSEIVDWIYEFEGETLEQLERKLKKSVAFKIEPNYHLEHPCMAISKILESMTIRQLLIHSIPPALTFTRKTRRRRPSRLPRSS